MSASENVTAERPSDIDNGQFSDKRIKLALEAVFEANALHQRLADLAGKGIVNDQLSNADFWQMKSMARRLWEIDDALLSALSDSKCADEAVARQLHGVLMTRESAEASHD